MATVFENIRERFIKALQMVLQTNDVVDPLLKETTDAKFGDYQANVAMSLAKKLKQSPRDVASQIVNHLNSEDFFEKVEIAGPGFINVFLKKEALEQELLKMQQSQSLGVFKPEKRLCHVVDFSSPNLAKEMHIGHLRTTLTGEVICRVLEFMGHTVERINHVGDWGTQFGMLLEYIYRNQPEVLKNPQSFAVTDLEGFYKKAKAQFDADLEFADAARKKVVLLQSGDPTALQVWQAFLHESLKHCHAIYKTLGVTLKDQGESFYQDRLKTVVEDMQNKGLAVEDEGAVCFFSKTYKNKDGKPLPVIVQKRDGGFNYATTDLAAIRYRVSDLKAHRLIYVTDIRQAQHFDMVFEAARAMNWALKSVQLDHIGYGMILGKDKKPFKTRDGNTVRLKDVIAQSLEKAKHILDKNDRGFSDEEKEAVSKKVGLAAIKYFDLSHNLSSDYVFDWDHMLAMEGNTGPYMLYAYARIKSIGRKAKVDFDSLLKENLNFCLQHPFEKKLAKALLKFPEVVFAVSCDLKPNSLTEYLYNLAKVFHNFYDKKTGVVVLEDKNPNLRQSRLALCALTALVLKTGLNLLSIDVVERM